jgi:hypothetical protein
MSLNISKYHNKHINYRYITLCILYITIFALPWNLFKVWRPESAYLNGHFIDYLAPKLYFSQLLIWVLWAWTLVSTRGRTRLIAIFPLKRQQLLSMLHIGLILGWQMIYLHDISYNVWLFNLLSGPFLLGWWLMIFPTHFFSPHFWKQVVMAVIASTTFQALLGMTQFATQTNQTPYWFFGETIFTFPKGLALSNLNPIQFILPSGTTPHPNVLASWILIGMLSSIIIWYIGKYRHPLIVIFFFFQSLALWFTESWTAWLSAPLLLWMVWLTQWPGLTKFGFSSLKKVVVITIILIQAIWLTIPQWLPTVGHWLPLERTSILRRTHLEEVTLSALRWHPIGTTLPEYFQAVFQAETSYIGSHFLQPVHNAGLFVTIFFGFWTLILITIFINSVQKYYSLFFLFLLAILPIFNLDHYLLSLLSGQYILMIMIVYFNFLTKNN